jgi:hypothetical protein
MRFRPVNHESILYVIAFILAAALRFIQLGALPLSDNEAGWALQALQTAQGTRPLLGPQPGYILPTSLLFFLFGDSNFLARFIPALTGSALILVPYLFRQRLRPVSSLLLAFFLALDPGLVSLSRQAEQPDTRPDLRPAGLGVLVGKTSAGGGHFWRVGAALGAVLLGWDAGTGAGLGPAPHHGIETRQPR